MAEQDNQRQNETESDETGATQDNARSDAQSGQGKQEPGNSSGADSEQSGEGTGAKAGEYS